MTETFISLLFAHTVADFVFQTNWMAANKRNPLVLGLHGLIVYATAVAATGSVHPVLLALALVHIGVDVGKLILAAVWKASKGFGPFVIDQALHIVSLIAATTTRKGLVVKAALDTRHGPPSHDLQKMTNTQMTMRRPRSTARSIVRPGSRDDA